MSAANNLAANQELLSAFIEELDGIYPLLKKATDEVEKTLDSPAQFEAFGQVIDRLYGTAATLG